MPISFELPADLESRLRRQFGDLDQQAREAFAVEGYRSSKLSIGQVAEILGTSIYEAEGFLKACGAVVGLSDAEVEEDLAALRETDRP
jgi:predicted HTH domain antitoxin